MQTQRTTYRRLFCLFLGAALGLGLFGGCASSGNQFAMADADGLVPGVSTLADARAKLGEPMKQQTSLTSGRTAAQWVFAKASVGHAEAQAVTIVFNRDGVMERITGRYQQK